MQETCTFCPGGDAEIADRTRRVPFVAGEDLVKRTGGFVGGFMHAAAQFDDMRVVGLNSPDGVFGGSSRSWESKESFEHFMRIILDDLQTQMPVQGVYLSLHGAMAVRDVPRPEAEIARRVREVVGPDVPIAGRHDLGRLPRVARREEESTHASAAVRSGPNKASADEIRIKLPGQ